jgi:hypothetical protein
MTMKKKLRLVCDDCNMEITDPRHGWLAWPREDRAKKRIRVVHAQYACPRWKHKQDEYPDRLFEHLHFFLGRLGLLDLVAKIEDNEWPLATCLELIRRLHFPGYEQYRLFRLEHNASGSEFELPAKPDGRGYRQYLALKKEAALHRQYE